MQVSPVYMRKKRNMPPTRPSRKREPVLIWYLERKVILVCLDRDAGGLANRWR